MHIILAILAAFVTIVGLLTFRQGAEDAAEKKEYEALRLSSLMIILGGFCFAFFVSDMITAIATAIISTIVLACCYFIVAYARCGKFSFESGKMHSNDAGAEEKKDAQKESSDHSLDAIAQ